ncbi:MAG: hypothetical protein Q8R36_01265 [bacterium]|nr:hypothetical protein [bacterium]
MAKKSLARKIKARQEFVVSIVHFVDTIIGSRAKNLRRFATPTTVERVACFTFSRGYSYTLGNELIVWYHPQSEKAENGQQVLNVQWFDIKKCEGLFAPSQKWQRIIKKLMREGIDKLIKRLAVEKISEETKQYSCRTAERLIAL